MVADTGVRVSRTKPMIVVFTIVALCLVGFVYLYNKAGGHLPGQGGGYDISFRSSDIKNVQPAAEVRIAGVKVGSVISQEVDGKEALVKIRLDDDFAPLHDGATVRVGVKSVLGQSFVELVDGEGTEIDEGTVLGGDSVLAPVDIDEVVATFDPETKESLKNLLRNLGPGTAQRSQQISQLLDGLGMLGREGYTAVDALAAQGEDLKKLINEGNTILAALNTGRDQIGSLVKNADTLTRVTANQDADLAATVQKLPALIDAADTATGTFEGLATDLDPVAKDLYAAAPDLSAALEDLPSVSGDLRELLPYMNASLGRANKTLVQVPALAKYLSAITPEASELLANVNPMVEYLDGWSLDLGSFFGNFGASFDTPIENGVQPVSLAPIFNEYSVRNNPLDLSTLNPLHWVNPYPDAGGALNPHPYRGKYPRIEKDK